MKIKLGDFQAPNDRLFAGYSYGAAISKYIGLKRLIAQHKRITFHIPEDVYLFTDSFFLGMFAEILKRFGEKRFRKQCVFTGFGIANVIERNLEGMSRYPT